MKMPTPVVASRNKLLPWKPGEHLSLAYGERSFSSPSPSLHDNRLPLVATDPTLATFLPRPPPRKSKEDVGSPSLSGPVGGADERRKRFPILGPTRQDTEMYFQRRRSGRRSARERSQVETRGPVTRSADRILLPSSTTTPRLLHLSVDLPPTAVNATTTLTTNTKLPPSPSEAEGSMCPPEADCQPPQSRVGPYLNSSCFEVIHHTDDSAFPSGFEPFAVVTTTPSPAHERLENSPEQLGAGLPLPLFEHLHGEFTVVKGLLEEKKKPEAALFSKTSGLHIVDVTQRLPKPYREQTQKTLQPSKHGFHRRSKSPTYKRLVKVVEKLQDIAELEQRQNSGPRHSLHRTSSVGIVLPAVAGVWDGAEAAEGEEGSDDEAVYLYPHPSLSSIPHSIYRNRLKGIVSPLKKQTRTIGTTMFTNPKELEAQARSGSRNDAGINNGLGALEVDSLSVESSTDPLRTAAPPDTRSSDTPTELHLFLPRLADMEEDSSKPSPTRNRGSKLAENQTQAPVQGGKTVPHIVHSHRAPQRCISNQSAWAGGERSARHPEKRFTSPGRGKRDRTPNNRRRVPAPVFDNYPAYEPYIKGEHLKEKLEDFPTLISLDQD